MDLRLWLYSLILLPLCAFGQRDCAAGSSSSWGTTWTIGVSTTTITYQTATYSDSTTAAAATKAATKEHRVLVVNNRWPAEAVAVKKCTLVTITVENSASTGEDVTLHFHGLTQNNGQVVMDGPQGLTQGGIQPGTSFTYQFLADAEGTYWIHSHHPGQYPKGLRIPMVVYNVEDPQSYKYTERADVKDEIITLSDWFSDFWDAELRGTLTANRPSPEMPICGVPGDVLTEAVVLFNDVLPEEIYPNNPLKSKRVVTVPCGETRRLRFINMSSQARFFVWFSDNRLFKVIELDGVSYNEYRTPLIEVASGQRVSITVSSGSTNFGLCKPAFIVVASDPKVGHGTRSCPQVYTDPRRGLQYTHGLLDVCDQATTSCSKDPGRSFSKLDVTNNQDLGNTQRFKVWKQETLSPAEVKRFHYYPNDGAMTVSVNSNRRAVENRLDLGWEDIWHNPDTPTDVAGTPCTGCQRLIVGPVDMKLRSMTPKAAQSAWIAPQPANGDGNEYMHYVRLGESNGGLAAMMENPNVNDFGWWDRVNPFSDKWQPFKSPGDRDDAFHIPPNQRPELPSLFRMLNDQFSDTDLKDPKHYSWEDPTRGHTIMVNDQGSAAEIEPQPHWFIIRSDRGDHPMHLHGHHFQVLAMLQPAYFQKNLLNARQLWDFVYNHLPANPPRRDTLWIEKSVTYVLAIKPDNPGVWAFHCHNDIHAVSGMFSQVIERPIALRDKLGTWKGINPVGSGHWDFAWAKPEKAAYTTLRKNLEYAFGLALTKMGYDTGKLHADPFATTTTTTPPKLAKKFIA